MALKQFGFYKYWLAPVISALGKSRQEHQGFKAGLEYKASSLQRVTRNPVFKNFKKEKQSNNQKRIWAIMDSRYMMDSKSVLYTPPLHRSLLICSLPVWKIESQAQNVTHKGSTTDPHPHLYHFISKQKSVHKMSFKKQ